MSVDPIVDYALEKLQGLLLSLSAPLGHFLTAQHIEVDFQFVFDISLCWPSTPLSVVKQRSLLSIV